ncbi:MAG TPA: tetratricopeptide repeat protein, partial [Vicinamibacteria bacterium]|nr:tetratricopeptide repeat protein [Vicinamibacteria bacterium]
MARANPLQLKRDADAAEKRGDYARAIDLLKQLVQENPKDWNTVNRIGDLYAKLNNLKAANEQYEKVARYYADDGFYLKAIAVWKKVLRNDPSMLDGSKELGELYARQGLVAEAKQTLNVVVDEYVKRSKKREAGEVLRRLADVDPADLNVRRRLAEFYAWDGNQEKANGEYVTIADELVKKGHLAEALQFIEKTLRSGPRSALLLVTAARIHLVQKTFPRAIELLEEARKLAPADRDVSLRLAEACVGSKRHDEARRVLEGLIERDPSDQEARLQIGQVYLAEGRYDEAFEHLQPAIDKLVERRQVDRGAALLQQIVQRNPSHIRSLAKLVELYRQSRNDSLVAQTYSQMVEAYLAGGGLDHAASILEMLVQLEPHNEQHRSKLRWLREQQGGPGGFEVDLDRPLSPPLPPPAALPSAPAARAAGLELSGPLSADDKEFIDEHLNEGRVFRKYGLVDKARDQLEAVLSRFPDNLEALQELVDLHREKGDGVAAAQRLRVIAEVYRLKGQPDKAKPFDAEAAALAPAPAAPPAPPAAPVPAARVTPAAPSPRPAPVTPAPPVAAPPGVEITLDEPTQEEPVPAEEPLLEEFEDLEPAPPEPEPHLFAVEDLAPAEGDIGGQFIEDEEPEAGFDLEEAAAGSPVTVGLVAHRTPAVAAAGEVPPELQRVLDEIESYVSMGFIEDARGVLNEVRGRFGAHPAFARRLAELGLDVEAVPVAVTPEDLLAEAPPPVALPSIGEEPLQLGSDFLEFTPTTPQPAAAETPPPVAPPGGGTDGFDLASELGGLFGAQPAVAAEPAAATATDLGDASLADIVREFQKGVDKQLGKEDYETRYNLGIAYKEMGLVDEAIAEFQLAAKDEARLLECASMLGICFVEKGMPKLAVKWFE